MIPLSIEHPFVLTIFGASGDLAKIKIFPSLYAITEQRRLPKDFHIVGYARTNMTREEFQKTVEQAIKKNLGRKPNPKVVKSLLRHVYYYAGQYKDEGDFRTYKKFVRQLCDEKAHPQLCYFSVPPKVFQSIIRNLVATRRSRKEDIRLVIEKPFGNDKKSAQKLFHFVSQYFDESQFYLLDHYLGKSSVQSILNMRHTNRVLSNIIKGAEIANIQITAFEKVGVDKRIGYFEQVGIIKDIIQSHLLQVFALVTMSIPSKHEAASLQREKLAMLEAIDCPCDDKNVVIGQYKSYTKHTEVPKNSKTETFAAVRLLVDRQNWHGVPIYIRTGKKLNEKHTYVVIELKKFPFQKKDEQPNRVIVEFYPEPKISLTLVDFQDGAQQYQSVTTSASIKCSVKGCLPEHADLLLDVMNKQQLHFLSFAEILASWEIIDNMLKNIKDQHVRLHKYEDGSTGPVAQKKLTKMDKFEWFDLH